MRIKVKKLSPDAVLPSYGSDFAAGADLRACTKEPITIEPHDTKMIGTGLAMEIPEGYMGLIFARSGIASKRGLAPANKVGVVDSDYRGEFMVALHNHSSEPQSIDAGERIAQLVIVPYMSAAFEEAEELSETVRADGGFGSTGKK